MRQSTLAKRSNVAPFVSSKKSSVKSASSPKTGQKQERSPTKETDVAAPLKTEQPKEVRRSTRRLGQIEGTGAAVTASQSNTKCLSGSEEVNERKSETLEQEKVEETSQQLSCADLSGSCSPPSGETKEVTEAATETESGNAESVCSVSVDAEITAVKNEANYAIDSMDSETSAEEKTENKTEELEKKTEARDQSEVTGKANDSSSACVNQSEISETSSILSGSVEEGVDCSLCSHSVEVHDENTLSVKKCETELVDDKGVGRTVTASEKILDSTEIGNEDLKNREFTSADPGNSVLESTVLDQTSQSLQQQISSIKVEGPVASKLQDDDKQISISTKSEKSIRPRHSKSITQNKQNLTAGTRQKPGTLQQEVTRSRTRAGLAISGLHSPSGLKRNADEQESHQHPSNPVKIRKKESDLSLKSKSCISAATVKKQSILKKIPRVQPSGQVQKSSIQRASEKSPTGQSCSKDTYYSVHSSGHASHPSQKQALGQKHQLAAVLKANSSMKEDVETLKDSPVLEHLKEDDKERNKTKRIDKNLQPRQRRSSKSLSLDEPPLFIPDNISTVKREGLEHTTASESKSVWVPSKQCGFCKKPHGNRCV